MTKCIHYTDTLYVTTYVYIYIYIYICIYEYGPIAHVFIVPYNTYIYIYVYTHAILRANRPRVASLRPRASSQLWHVSYHVMLCYVMSCDAMLYIYIYIYTHMYICTSIVIIIIIIMITIIIMRITILYHIIPYYTIL